MWVMGRRQFAIHRWLTAVVSIQLFLWSLGGLIFATHDIDWVRGQDGRNKDAKAMVDLASITVTPLNAAALAELSQPIESIVIRTLLGRTVYEVRGEKRTVVVDAINGELLTPIKKATAVAVALADRLREAKVQSVALIKDDPPIEYRGRPLPAWKVSLADDEETHIYVAADTGRITARRNNAWRRFDFFWMLHTMDYDGRDDFNHFLLIAFAALGLAAVLSGWVLWGARLRRRLRKRAGVKVTSAS